MNVSLFWGRTILQVILLVIINIIMLVMMMPQFRLAGKRLSLHFYSFVHSTGSQEERRTIMNERRGDGGERHEDEEEHR